MLLVNYIIYIANSFVKFSRALDRVKYLLEIFKGKIKGPLLLVESLCDQKLIKEGPTLNKVILLQIAINFIKELLEFFGNSEVQDGSVLYFL